MTKSCARRGGFTLLEILLVVGIIAILAGIVILAINPSKQLGDSRDSQRRSDVLTILNAIYQYSIDNDGDLTEINDGIEIIESDADCIDSIDDTDADAINLDTSLVGASSTYLTDIPSDPTAEAGESRYYVVRRDSGRITVCAPYAENNLIEVTR